MLTPTTNAFGTNPILIASKGVIINPADIVGPISLRYEIKNVFSIIKDDSILTSPNIHVKRQIEVDVVATLIIETPPAALNIGTASAYNQVMRQRAIDLYLSEHKPETTAKEDGEEVKTKRRGRKSRREREREEEAEEVTTAAPEISESDIDARIWNTAIDIVVDKTIIEDANIVPLTSSPAYKMVSDISEKNEIALSNNLARLRKAISTRGEASQNLRSGSSENIDEITNDLVPSLGKDLRAIDESGMKGYEERLREEVTKTEESIRTIYDFFETKVIAKYNAEMKMKTGLFTENEISVVGNVISRKDALDKLFKEELISIPFGTSSKK